MGNNRLSVLGIVFGMVAGASWGLAFLIPNMLSAFTSLDITLGRYFMYGLFSVFLFMAYRKNPFHIPLRVWLTALLYALIGNVGYFFCLVLGIQYAGATVTTLIIGTLPITVSFFGNLLNKQIPSKIMLIPASSILIGIFLLYSGERGNGSGAQASQGDFLFGFVCCIIAVALWTWYGISNAKFLKKETTVSADLFSTLVGIQTLPLVLIVPLFGWMTNRPFISDLAARDEWIGYLIGVFVLGVVASWVATWAWNQTSIRLSVPMAGMMIVFESLFGLLYTFVYEARFPLTVEWLSIVFILIGVTFGIWRINTYRQPNDVAA